MTDTVTQTPGTTTTATTTTPAWHAGLQPELAQWSAGKGYDLTDPAKAASMALQGHWNAEKMIGADRAGRTVVLPSDDNDVEGWKAVYNKLGRPEQPAQYELKVPEGADPQFAEQASSWMHEAGIPKKAAQHIAEKWNQHMAQAGEAQRQAEEAKLAEEHKSLEKDWGTGDAAAINREMARRAAQKLGLDEGAIDALQKVSGYSKTMKALAQMGTMLGERPAAGLDAAGGGFALTPEAAKGQRAAAMADKEFVGKAMNPNSQEFKKLQTWDTIIAEHNARQFA